MAKAPEKQVLGVLFSGQRSAPLVGAAISVALQLAGFMVLLVLARPLLALVPVNHWTIEGAMLLVLVCGFGLGLFAAHAARH